MGLEVIMKPTFMELFGTAMSAGGHHPLLRHRTGVNPKGSALVGGEFGSQRGRHSHQLWGAGAAQRERSSETFGRLCCGMLAEQGANPRSMKAGRRSVRTLFTSKSLRLLASRCFALRALSLSLKLMSIPRCVATRIARTTRIATALPITPLQRTARRTAAKESIPGKRIIRVQLPVNGLNWPIVMPALGVTYANSTGQGGVHRLDQLSLVIHQRRHECVGAAS